MSEFTATKIADGFWSIEQSGVRSYLFIGEDRAMLVDTCFSGDIKSTCQSVTALPIFVVTTHSDGDHIGCDHQFDERYLHPAERSSYEERNKRLASTLPIWEGDVIDIGTFKFEVILLPGHTPGSIVLLERDKRFLIGGDTIQNGGVYMFGQGRNIYAYRESMIKMRKYAGDFDTVYGSHGEMTAPPSIIETLIEAVDKILAGEVEGAAMPDRFPSGVKSYVYNGASFIWQRPE